MTLIVMASENLKSVLASRVASKYLTSTLSRRVAEKYLESLQESESSTDRSAYIKKVPGKGYCVKSKKNPDWSGGCYPTKEKAEKRLTQVEMFKHMKKRSSYDKVETDVTYIGREAYKNDKQYIKEVDEIFNYLNQRIKHSDKIQKLYDANETRNSLWDKWDHSFSAANNYDDWKKWPSNHPIAKTFFDMIRADIRKASRNPFATYVNFSYGPGFALFSGDSEEEIINVITSQEEEKPLTWESISKSKAIKKIHEPDQPKLKVIKSSYDKFASFTNDDLAKKLNDGDYFPANIYRGKFQIWKDDTDKNSNKDFPGAEYAISEHDNLGAGIFVPTVFVDPEGTGHDVCAYWHLSLREWIACEELP